MANYNLINEQMQPACEVQENGLDIQKLMEKGAVVIAEGADRPAVKLNLIQAVSSLTGLGMDQITVIKMRGY